jgi:hypothetical protein
MKLSIAILLSIFSLAPAKPLPLVFRCPADNDLYRALQRVGAAGPRYATAEEAVSRAPRGSAVLILADGYPERPTPIDASVYRAAEKKQLRIFVEYPSALPGVAVGAPRTVKWERAVVASNTFAPELEKLRILGLHHLTYLPVEVPGADIAVARVAGLDTAVYGLPNKDVHPLLFRLNEGRLWVATTQLSQFVSARYAPGDAWAPIWKRILTDLAPAIKLDGFNWTPTVRPTYSASAELPADAERAALKRATEAYAKARLLVHPQWRAEVAKRGLLNDSVGALPPADWPVGDGSEGVLEGFSSSIAPDGKQPIRWALRDDCIGEVSLQFALWSRVQKDAAAARTAENLNDFLYTRGALAPRRQGAAAGLLGWVYPGNEGVYYGDDNARSMLGTLGTAGALGIDKWDEPLLRVLLGNLRTTGVLGFRDSRIDLAPLEKNGWRHYWEAKNTNYSPHYDAYLWASFLWAYARTGYAPFLERTETALGMMMTAYPSGWRWTNGLQQERARMLLPLAWLVRVKDTPEHRAWLARVATDLLNAQDASGAIREELGEPGKGDYPPARSNEEYGKRESTLIQQNGDPIADLLYTTNFAFLGLHEAAAATGDARYRDGANKLAGFLCRIQTRSEAHPELDGWWFRAFDFRRWDYWASNADAGWGAWSAETGWTQSWISSVLAMRQLNTSLWELGSTSRIGIRLKPAIEEMIPAP